MRISVVAYGLVRGSDNFVLHGRWAEMESVENNNIAKSKSEI
jgi:hypothetical protein